MSEKVRTIKHSVESIRENKADRSSAIRYGCLAWIAFSIVAVLLRGIRWDENYEFAQIILGRISLPEGHPVATYVTGAFSLQTYMTAALLSLFSSASWVCGIRNVLFMMATVVPIYLLAAHLSHRSLWGHVAAVLVLIGIHLEFDSSYPQFIWPDMFSNGHIGTGYALLVVYFLLVNQWRTGFFLLGLMPCIHMGQIPPVLFLGGVLWLALCWRRMNAEATRAALAFLAGIACCVLFWLIQRWYIIPPASGGAYSPPGNPVEIMTGYLAGHDLHRSIPIGNCHLALGGLLILLGWMTYEEGRTRDQSRVATWLLIYVLGIAGLVCGTLVIHLAMGPDMPSILLRWMPYRLLNHAPLLLIVTICAVLSGATRSASNTSGKRILVLALLYCVAIPYLSPWLPHAIYGRYLVPQAGLLFGLAGAAMGSLPRMHDGERRSVVVLFVVAMLMECVLLRFHRFGALSFAAGFTFAFALQAMSQRSTRPFAWSEKMAMVLCSVFCVLVLRTEFVNRQNLPMSPFRQSAAAFLAKQEDSQAMLVGEPYQLLLQAHTHHPVMTDMALPTWIPYMPALGPGIEKMYREIYGIHLAHLPAQQKNESRDDWKATWRARTPKEWRDLASRYGFQYVAAPNDARLNLSAVVSETFDTLYVTTEP